MSKRIAGRLGWSLFALSALLLAVAFVLNLGRPQYAGLGATTGELVLGPVLLLFGWFGALIVSRQPHQPIGWILSAFGGSSGPVAFANEYAIYGLITHPGAAPGAAAVAWFTTWVSAVYLGLLAALLLLFPTGRPPRRAGVGGCGWPASATSCTSSRRCGHGPSVAPTSCCWGFPIRSASPACCSRSGPQSARLRRWSPASRCWCASAALGGSSASRSSGCCMRS